MHPLIKPIAIFTVINFMGFLIIKLIVFNSQFQLQSTFRQTMENFTQFKQSIKVDLREQQKVNLIRQSEEKKQLINETIKIFEQHNFVGSWKRNDFQKSGEPLLIPEQKVNTGKVYLNSIQINPTRILNFHLQTKYYEQITLVISIYRGQQGQDGTERFEISFDPYDTQINYDEAKNQIKLETIPDSPVLINIRNNQYRTAFYAWKLHRTQDTKFKSFNLQFKVPSESANVQEFRLAFQIQQKDPEKLYTSIYNFQLKQSASQKFFWGQIIYFFIISNLLMAQLYFMLIIANDPAIFHAQLLKISYYTVLPKFILDISICVSMFYALIMTQNYSVINMTQFAFTINPFVIIGVGIFGITSYITDFWLLLVLREHMNGHADPWNRVFSNPDQKQVRNLLFVSFVTSLTTFLFNYGYYFTLIYSLKPFIQVFHNITLRKKPDLSSSWYKIMSLQIITLIFFRNSIVNPYDVKSFAAQVGTLGFLLLIGLILIEYLILYAQQRWGPIRCLPKMLRPKFNGYSYQYQLKEQKSMQNISQSERDQKQICAICLMDLNEDVSKIFGLKQQTRQPNIAYRVMKAPCNHLYHSCCLLQWMQQKMECPKCRVKLPPVQQSW